MRTIKSTFKYKHFYLSGYILSRYESRCRRERLKISLNWVDKFSAKEILWKIISKSAYKRFFSAFIFEDKWIFFIHFISFYETMALITFFLLVVYRVTWDIKSLLINVLNESSYDLIHVCQMNQDIKSCMYHAEIGDSVLNFLQIISKRLCSKSSAQKMYHRARLSWTLWLFKIRVAL